MAAGRGLRDRRGLPGRAADTPGSACSVIFGTGLTSAAPGSAQGLQLVVTVVTDIDTARAELAGRGAEVSEPGLVIFSVYNGYWFWGRPSFEDLRRDLREGTREIRPDWDLAAPGLRENWEAGDHSTHHPYQQADRMRTVTPLSVQEN